MGLLPVTDRRIDDPALPADGRGRPGKITVDVDHDLLEQARDAVIHLSGPPHRMTMRTLVESALRRELQRLRDESSHAGICIAKWWERRQRADH